MRHNASTVPTRKHDQLEPELLHSRSEYAIRDARRLGVERTDSDYKHKILFENRQQRTTAAVNKNKMEENHHAQSKAIGWTFWSVMKTQKLGMKSDCIFQPGQFCSFLIECCQ
jgi:hypothetical protein